MVKLKAVVELETTEQVVLMLDFARTMGLKMEMGGELERKSVAERVSVGVDTELLPKHKKLYAVASKIVKDHGGTMLRADLVQELAKATRKQPRHVGSAVVSWIKRGALKGE